MSLLLFRLYDQPHPGLYRFDGIEEDGVYLEKLDGNTLEPTGDCISVETPVILQAIADVRNEIVDGSPDLDPIELANIASDLLQILENAPNDKAVDFLRMANSFIKLREELKKWKPLIAQFPLPFTD